jgi:hypothetical protein
MPCFVVIPFVYIFYVMFDVWRRKLLPPKGRRRGLSIYFFRVFIVFLIIWAPFIVLFYPLGGTSRWVVWVSCIWAHAQAVVSACVSLMKPDIALAARQLMACRIKELRGKTGDEYGASSMWYDMSPPSAQNFVDVPRQSVEGYEFEDEKPDLPTDSGSHTDSLHNEPSEPLDESSHEASENVDPTQSLTIESKEDDETNLPVAPLGDLEESDDEYDATNSVSV